MVASCHAIINHDAERSDLTHLFNAQARRRQLHPPLSRAVSLEYDLPGLRCVQLKSWIVDQWIMDYEIPISVIEPTGHAYRQVTSQVCLCSMRVNVNIKLIV